DAEELAADVVVAMRLRVLVRAQRLVALDHPLGLAVPARRAPAEDLRRERREPGIAAKRSQVAIAIEIVLEIEAGVVGLAEPLACLVLLAGARERAGRVVRRRLLPVPRLVRRDELGGRLLVPLVRVELRRAMVRAPPAPTRARRRVPDESACQERHQCC